VTSSLVSPATRQRVRDLATPIAIALGRLGLTPNALTLIGFAGTCVAAYAAANRKWVIAGLLVLAFGIFDLFDGTLARATGRTSRFGAFLDSVFDRAGEAIVYIGVAGGALALGFAGGALLAAAAMGASFMVSYTRAKSESLGFTPGTRMANVGIAPREVRLLILALGLVLTGGTAGDRASKLAALAGPLILITILATVTTIQRILHVRAQAKEG
jgi:phosphatidylglycerophosphate synthase